MGMYVLVLYYMMTHPDFGNGRRMEGVPDLPCKCFQEHHQTVNLHTSGGGTGHTAEQRNYHHERMRE